MKKKLLILFAVLTAFLNRSAWAEIINVGLEPFPPLITKDGKGYSVDMLRAVEKISDLTFNITVMPYNRAKHELKKGRVDLIGHTPHQLETKEFYTYAQELEWGIIVPVDIYSMNEANLDPKIFRTLKRIGTPRGNEGFFSQLYGIPIKQFHTGTIESLLRMMKKGRSDLFLFERASTMSRIQKLGIKNVFYRQIDRIPASFAVRKSEHGTELKNKLDALIKKVDQERIFSGVTKYWSLPESGVVPVPEK